LDALKIVNALESNGLGQTGRLGDEFLTGLVVTAVCCEVIPICAPFFLVGATDIE
jgi:hypothetical protein